MRTVEAPVRRRSLVPALVALAVLVTAAARLAYLLSPVMQFNADEATTGIMVRRILHGHGYVFYAGQDYGGALEQYLEAAVYAVFRLPQNELTLRLPLVALSLLTCGLVYLVGRDMLGDDVPPDELNRAPRPGMDFGYPTCHGRNILDPELGRRRPCSATTPPALELGPHVAALGMRFYTGRSFPEKYRNGIFIAEHGSWNRSHKIGYRVMFVPLQNGQPAGYEVFAQGWLQGEKPWGRPVDVLMMPDGAILVSDDFAGAIYRISYRG